MLELKEDPIPNVPFWFYVFIESCENEIPTNVHSRKHVQMLGNKWKVPEKRCKCSVNRKVLFLHLLEWIHVGTLKEDPIPNVPFWFYVFIESWENEIPTNVHSRKHVQMLENMWKVQEKRWIACGERSEHRDVCMRVIDALAQTSLRSLRSPCQRGVNVVLSYFYICWNGCMLEPWKKIQFRMCLFDFMFLQSLGKMKFQQMYILGNMIKC